MCGAHQMGHWRRRSVRGHGLLSILLAKHLYSTWFLIQRRLTGSIGGHGRYRRLLLVHRDGKCSAKFKLLSHLWEKAKGDAEVPKLHPFVQRMPRCKKKRLGFTLDKSTGWEGLWFSDTKNILPHRSFLCISVLDILQRTCIFKAYVRTIPLLTYPRGGGNFPTPIKPVSHPQSNFSNLFLFIFS